MTHVEADAAVRADLVQEPSRQVAQAGEARRRRRQERLHDSAERPAALVVRGGDCPLLWLLFLQQLGSKDRKSLESARILVQFWKLCYKSLDLRSGRFLLQQASRICSLTADSG